MVAVLSLVALVARMCLDRPITAEAGQCLLLALVALIAIVINMIRSKRIGDVECTRAEIALRQAEERYRNMFDNAVEGMYQTSADGKYLAANPALARIYGFCTPEDLIRQRDDIEAQLYVDPNRRAELIAILAEQGKVADAESQVYRRDGSVMWIAESMQAVTDAVGNILYYEGTVQDISGRRAMEEERAARLAEALDRAERDPLTGLLNHRAFHNKLQELSISALRGGTRCALMMLDLDNFKFFNDAYGHVVGDDVLRHVAAALSAACKPGDVIARFGGDEFAVLLPERSPGGVELAIEDIKSAVDDLRYEAPGYDCAIPMAVSCGTVIFPDEAADRTAALELADTRMLRSKRGQDDLPGVDALKRSASEEVSGFSMLDALVIAVDNKDRYTSRHSEDVLRYSVEIAEELKLGDAAVHQLRLAALLHDVGKIGVPDYILRKPGKLTAEEYEAVKLHPMMGASIVATVPGLESTLDAVRHHHERWDGKGYPFGLRGENIPLTARIMAVADAFSAMTTDRPYRKGMPVEIALSKIAESAGTQLDPHIAAALLRARGAWNISDSSDHASFVPALASTHA